jgi:hypothetical protein
MMSPMEVRRDHSATRALGNGQTHHAVSQASERRTSLTPAPHAATSARQ